MENYTYITFVNHQRILKYSEFSLFCNYIQFFFVIPINLVFPLDMYNFIRNVYVEDYILVINNH